MALQHYRSKRDFKNTPEPKGKLSQLNGQRFVVHEHHASHLHYDFRLEIGGVLKSWAIPKGPSLNPADKRLAVMVEDHPVDYLHFQGHIAAGNYGAGDVIIWDEGTYRLVANDDSLQGLKDGRLSLYLYGEKLHGVFHLIRMAGQTRHWLFIKGDDEYAQPDKYAARVPGKDAVVTPKRQSASSRLPPAPTKRAKTPPADARVPVRKGKTDVMGAAIPGAVPAPMPSIIDPMRATLVDKPFSNPEWIYEYKWDGVRALCFIADSRARLFSRKEKELGFRYPEFAKLHNYIKAEQAILDGEIVSLDQNGIPNFQQLQLRIGLKGKADIQRAATEHPAVYYAFDLIYYNGLNLMHTPLIARKALLKQCLIENPVVCFSDHTKGTGEALFRKAAKSGLEGVIAKHRDSLYTQKGSGAWLKFKVVKRQEVVIVGYTNPRGTRPYFGALVVGLYDDNKLHYVGRVGGGFNHRSLEQVYELMRKLRTDEEPPFEETSHPNEPVNWIKPQLVCEVKFSEWTSDKRMRHPVFIGIRDDKDPHECKFEFEHATDDQIRAAQRHKMLSPSTPRHNTLRPEEFLRSRHVVDELKIATDGYSVSLTHLEKLYWPEQGINKGDLLKYYCAMAPHIIPYIKNRPLILKRYPDGVNEPFFYQHDIDNAPEFLRTIRLKTDEGRTLNYALCDNLAGLLYIVNLGTIAQHPWHSRVGTLDYPDWMVFDLDPQGVDFNSVCDVALALRDILSRLGLSAYVKTSGSRGMHVYVPVQPTYTYERVASFAASVARIVERRNPSLVTLERSLAKRPTACVYLDHLQNARGKTIVSAYSPREREEATVSTPLKWREVDRKLNPKIFTLAKARQRVTKQGDVFLPILTQPQGLEDATIKLAGLMTEKINVPRPNQGLKSAHQRHL
ncbi:MAG TPA: DNA ligase D [Gammaproteobacteria bacterium]|nr:DNA ligase D [Gammaproteobacteria bacterium]